MSLTQDDLHGHEIGVMKLHGENQSFFNVFAVLGDVAGIGVRKTEAWYLLTFEKTSLTFMDISGYWLVSDNTDGSTFRLYSPADEAPDEVRILTGMVLDDITSSVTMAVRADSTMTPRTSPPDTKSFVSLHIPIAVQMAMSKAAIEEGMEEMNFVSDDIPESFRISSEDVSFGDSIIHDFHGGTSSLAPETVEFVKENVMSVLGHCHEEMDMVCCNRHYLNTNASTLFTYLEFVCVVPAEKAILTEKCGQGR